MRPFKIALCQITPSFDKAENVERAAAMIETAARSGAHLVALPEMFYYPYELLRLRGIEGDEAAILKRFREIAHAHGVYLCSGSMVFKQDRHWFNTSHLIGPSGDELLSYSKCHLFDCLLDGVRVKESLVFSHGDRLPVAATELGNIGIIICYDIRFPEMARRAALLGAELLIVPAVFNQVTGPAHWSCLVRTRAIENQFFVAAISQGRNNDSRVHYKAYGHSMVAAPWGDVLAEAGEDETILYVDLDPELIASARKRMPLLQHRRDKLYTSFNRSQPIRYE
ncbi:MAG: carbon-nitrogen hydrolase family protein [Chitinispirillaceae bacterium]|nr:carbon-nitrogen hydrolase family protein [Chitinispirillaceae bacterium]